MTCSRPILIPSLRPGSLSYVTIQPIANIVGPSEATTLG